MRTASKLANFFDEAIRINARRAVITGKNGEYTAYGRYYIKPYQLEYTIHDVNTGEIITLSSLKHALSWCTLTDCQKNIEARRLEALDLKLTSITLDMAIHKNLVKTALSDTKLVYMIKLQEDSYKKKTVTSEIATLINKSKSLQEARFKKPKQNKFSNW